MTEPQVFVEPTEYTVCALPLDHSEAPTFMLTVAWGSPDRWAVRRGPYCWHTDTGWDYERRPSERDEAWKSETRFPLDEALRIAREQAPLVRVNNWTPAEVLERWPS
jgi:hypothetical protein